MRVTEEEKKIINTFKLQQNIIAASQIQLITGTRPKPVYGPHGMTDWIVMAAVQAVVCAAGRECAVPRGRPGAVLEIASASFGKQEKAKWRAISGPPVTAHQEQHIAATGTREAQGVMGKTKRTAMPVIIFRQVMKDLGGWQRFLVDILGS